MNEKQKCGLRAFLRKLDWEVSIAKKQRRDDNDPCVVVFPDYAECYSIARKSTASVYDDLSIQPFFVIPTETSEVIALKNLLEGYVAT